MVINLEKVDELIEKLTGEETVKLVRLIIEGKENVSEFILAEKLEIKINTVRNMLYGLQKYNLVTSMRKKDKQKGWYIYYWTFNEVQAKVLMKTVKQEETPKEDLKFKQEDLQISVERDSLEYLNNTEIDFLDSLKESGFKFNNPNASKECGCGKSFS